MKGSEAKRVIAARLQSDLRSAFADAVVEFTEEDLFRVTTQDGWAASGCAIDDDDDVSDHEVEELVAATGRTWETISCPTGGTSGLLLGHRNFDHPVRAEPDRVASHKR